MIKTIIISDRYKFVYFMVPKCATRSLLNYFVRAGNMNYGATHTINRGGYSKRYFQFTFVRNPYSRIVSCYLNKVTNTTQEAINKILKPHNLQHNMSFEAFVKKICFDKKCEQHWCPQTMFVPKTIDYIGYLETFNKDFKCILREIGLPRFPIGRANPTSHKRNKPWQQFYTPKLQEMVFKKYKQDFIRFGYDKNSLYNKP